MHFPVASFNPIHEHSYQLLLLSDMPRIAAYRKALSEVIVPGNVVADVGCGSGVLGRLAIEHGAAKVYAIDSNEDNVALAEGLNGIYFPGASVQYFCADASKVNLPEPVDVVVSELIGILGFDEAMSETLSAFCSRNLKPQGRTCPRQLEVFASPCRWRPAGELQVPKAFTSVTPVPEGNQLLLYLETDPATLQLLKPPQLVGSIDGLGNFSEGSGWNIDVQDIAKDLNAVAIWFRASLSSSTVIDSGPNGTRTHWGITIAELPPGSNLPGGSTLIRLKLETDEKLATTVRLAS